MRILACDLSSTSGFAWDGPNGRPQFSTLKGRMPQGPEPDFGPLFGALAQRLRDLIAWMGKDGKPDIIACEAPWIPIPRSGDDSTKTAQTAGPDVVFMLCGMAAVAWTVAHAHGIPFRRRAASTARKFFTGQGKTLKGGEDIKKIVQRRCYLLNWNTADEHQADAACLWAHEKHLVDRSFVLPPPGMLFAPGRMRVTA